MKLRPCIDIHDGRVKQIIGSTLSDAPGEGPGQNFVSGKGASYYAEIYKSHQLHGGHIIFLNKAGTKEYEMDRSEGIAALRAYPGGMQIGGGITPENAGEFLEAGASHVIVTSYVFRDGRLDEERLEAMLAAVGKEHLVLDLSCRKQEDGTYRVVTDRWQKVTDMAVNDETLDRLSSKCDEFLIHAADVEGKKAGIAEDLVRLLGAWQKKTGFPVTYAGGVHELSDMKKIDMLSGGYMDVTVGSALDLFGGDLSLEELIDSCRDCS